MIIEDFSYFYGDYSWRSMDLSAMSDECTAGFQKEPAFDQYNAVFEYPDEFLGNYIYIQGDQGGEGNVRSVYPESYRLIRNCNDFLEKIIDAPMNEDEKKTTIGEVKFLRAWVYFTLVKRYGGVPLIDKPQQYTGKESLAELEVPRSTEEEIFRFIIKDCKEAAEALPEVRTTEKARVTRYAALALCSRAALYAGSIAKYGKVGLGKLTGIESSKADEFYQIAYDAADFIIKKGPYKLFNQIPDKEQNFNKLFVTKDNGEYIFEKLFDVATGLGNSYDKKHLPYSYCRWGSITPTFEMVEAFEYQDGSEGKIDIGQSFETTYEMFQGKDPRFLASIYVPGSSLLGSTMQFQRGLILKDGSKYYAQSAPGPSYLLETYIDPETQRKDTILVSIMTANNEIGTIQAIPELASLVKANSRAIFHTDAVQAYGQIPIDITKMNVDLLSASAHKFYGPKGAGFLYIREGVNLPSFHHGGKQERGLRAGTENVPALVGMGKAAQLANEILTEKSNTMSQLRDYMIHRIEQEIPYCHLNGSRRKRLPNNINISFSFVDGETIVIFVRYGRNLRLCRLRLQCWSIHHLSCN